MYLLVISELVPDTKRTYRNRYELQHCQKCALFRKSQLMSLYFIRSVELIPIECNQILNHHENI